MSRQDHVTDDDALCQQSGMGGLVNRGAGLVNHLPDGSRRCLKIVLCPGISLGQTVIIVLEVRKPYVHIILQGLYCLHTFISAAVIDHRDGKPGAHLVQGGDDMGQVLGGCHQIYVIRPLVLEPEEYLGQFLRGQLTAEMSAADSVVLAETASQGTPGEEYGAAASGGRDTAARYRGTSVRCRDTAGIPTAADTGLFPVVEGGPCSCKAMAAAAEPGGAAAVDSAHTGAEAAVCVCVKGKDIGCIHVG